MEAASAFRSQTRLLGFQAQLWVGLGPRSDPHSLRLCSRRWVKSTVLGLGAIQKETGELHVICFI